MLVLCCLQAPLVKLPNPKYTNYLTDIRKFEIAHHPLQDVGFLSNDSSDEEAELNVPTPLVAGNNRTRQTSQQVSCYFWLALYEYGGQHCQQKFTF